MQNFIKTNHYKKKKKKIIVKKNMEQIIVNKIEGQIEILSYRNCEGCRLIVNSFKNHSCYVDSWSWKVGLYFDTACKELLESKEIDENFFDRERILEILNGTSNVESTQFSS